MKVTIKNPIRLACIIAGVVAYYVIGGGYLALVFAFGAFVGSFQPNGD